MRGCSNSSWRPRWAMFSSPSSPAGPSHPPLGLGTLGTIWSPKPLFRTKEESHEHYAQKKLKTVVLKPIGHPQGMGPRCSGQASKLGIRKCSQESVVRSLAGQGGLDGPSLPGHPGRIFYWPFRTMAPEGRNRIPFSLDALGWETQQTHEFLKLGRAVHGQCCHGAAVTWFQQMCTGNPFPVQKGLYVHHTGPGQTKGNGDRVPEHGCAMDTAWGGWCECVRGSPSPGPFHRGDENAASGARWKRDGGGRSVRPVGPHFGVCLGCGPLG